MGEFYFSCRRRRLLQALVQLGLSIERGGKHDKAECISNGHKTTVPRHVMIKREIVESIAKFLLEKDFEKQRLLDPLR